MHRHEVATPRGRSSLTICRRTCAGTGRHCMPARSAEGEPSTRAADRLTSAVPMHSAARKPGVGGSGCAWQYATPGPRSTCQALCSETPTPDEALACGHSRSGIQRLCRVRLEAQDPGFWLRRCFAEQSGYAGSIPARDTSTRACVELTLRRWKSAATIGRRRNP